MGRIFCVMGKSATGKDHIFKRILENESLGLEKIISYTTRPIRKGETDGKEYHFTDEEGFKKLQSDGKVIETRVYDTALGPWRYFTVDDGIDREKNYLIIGTLEQFVALRDYFGEDRVVAIYVEVDDGERLQRALKRERKQEVPKYAEMCRRFLADAEDFAEEKLEKEGVTNRFSNEVLDTCVANIEEFISGYKGQSDNRPLSGAANPGATAG